MSRAHFSWQEAVCESDLSACCKLTLLVIGTHMNQYGGGAFPSYNTIAKHSSLSRRKVIEAVEEAEVSGWIKKNTRVRDNKSSTSNEYLISYPEPGAHDALGGACGALGGAHDALGGACGALGGACGALGGACGAPHINTPANTTANTPAKTGPTEKPKHTKQELTFTDYRKQLQQQGEKFLPDDDPLFTWAESVALPDGYISLAWLEFKSRHATDAKKQKDWRAVFRRAVREDWLKLWAIGRDGEYYLTTKGKMIERERDASRN